MIVRISTALFLALAPVTAVANQCPTMMTAIDAALPNASLSEADMAKVKQLRQQGEPVAPVRRPHWLGGSTRGSEENARTLKSRIAPAL